MLKNKIEAVVFDVDGTLYPNYKMNINAIAFFFMHPFFATAFKRIRQKAHNCKNISAQNQAELLAKALNISTEKTLFYIKKYIHQQFVSMFKWVKPYKTVEPLLIEFKKKGVKTWSNIRFSCRREALFFGT